MPHADDLAPSACIASGHDLALATRPVPGTHSRDAAGRRGPGRRARTWLAAAGVGMLSACTGIPEGIEAVAHVEPERYLGSWYEIARLDHSFERGLSEVTATYARRDDGGISVVNRGFDAGKGEWSQAEGRAYPIEDGDYTRLKVSFFGPFYGGYNIIALDENYQWAMVTGPNRDYLWILARSPDLAGSITEALVARAEKLGFAVDELIYVEHRER